MRISNWSTFWNEDHPFFVLISHTDSCLIAQVGQRQNHEYYQRERSEHDNRFADFPAPSISVFVKCDQSLLGLTNSPLVGSLYAGSTYCTRISAKAYSENAQKYTREELWSLLRTIHESPKLPAKEKRRLLEQFYKGHPEIFVQYFGNRLSTINMLLQWYLLVQYFMYYKKKQM